MFTGLIIAILGMFGVADNATVTEPVVVEHVVHDGDQGNIGDVPAGDIVTVRWDGADGADEAYYGQLCNDYGGEFQVRMLEGNLTATCFNVDN
jgi:hypothetical protein